MGVEIGGQSSVVTCSSRDQEQPGTEVLLVALVWVPAPYYPAGVKKGTSLDSAGLCELGLGLEDGGGWEPAMRAGDPSLGQCVRCPSLAYFLNIPTPWPFDWKERVCLGPG